MRSTWLVTLLALGITIGPGRSARADEASPPIDVDRVEYVDVLTMKDGSIWRGVIIEQTPGVNFKVALSGGNVQVVLAEGVATVRKERNPRFAAVTPAAPAAPAPAAGGDRGVDHLRGQARKPTGVVLGAGLTLAIPVGDLVDDDADTGVSPGVQLHVGYRYRKEKLAAQVGAQGRFTYWDVPGSPNDAFLWTLEMHGYARAARKSESFEPYLGLSLGADLTGYDLPGLSSGTGVGFGIVVSAGVALVATRSIDIELELSYHPPLSPIPFANVDVKVSYVGLQLGGAFHR